MRRQSSPPTPRRSVLRRIGVVLTMAAIALLLGTFTARDRARAAALTVYSDALAPSWTSCSWGSSVDFATTGQVYGGARAIRLTVASPGGGLCLRADQALDSAAFSDLRFAAKADKSVQRYQVFLYDAAMQPLGYVWLANAGGDPTATAWRVYTIPLAGLGAAGRQIRGVALQAIDGATGQSLYLDQIELVGAPASTPAPTPAPTPPATTGSSLPIYGDALAVGWSSCSWDTAIDLGATVPVHTGSRAIAAAPTAPRGGVCLFANNPIDTTPYATLRFAARTALDGQRYQVFLYDAAGQPVGAYLWLSSVSGDPVAGAWRVYDIPLRVLGGDNRLIKGVAIQQIDSGIGGTLYLDEIALVAATTPSSSPLPTPPPPVPSTPIALGAYISGAPTDPAQIDIFAALAGEQPSVVMWYVGWGLKSQGQFDPAGMNAVAARGAMPMVTWMPWEHDLGPAQPAFALKTITAGAHDDYIQRWAQAAAAWGLPMYLRFAHEMNGTWYPWSPGVNGNTSADFIAAWRRIHDIFQQAGATNVRWVWSPNVLTHGAGPFTDMYPGDAYVDWVALSGYNFGPTQPLQVWQSLAQVFGHSYDQLTALTTKPVMIAETASAEAGGSKASWITQGLLSDVPSRLPRVRAVIWFHENKEADWRIHSSAAAQAAFMHVADSATYRGRLP